MARLIDDLLFFARVGRGEMRTARIAMDHLVRQAIEMANREATRSDIVWHIARLPEVHADPEMLRLVLADLLSNAIKYTRTSTPPVIEIACENHETETVFSIRDNGVGFDMRYANKLFGVFQRLHRAAEFEGTGIGLASVRRIIARHGGRTWVRALRSISHSHASPQRTTLHPGPWQTRPLGPYHPPLKLRPSFRPTSKRTFICLPNSTPQGYQFSGFVTHKLGRAAFSESAVRTRRDHPPITTVHR